MITWYLCALLSLKERKKDKRKQEKRNTYPDNGHLHEFQHDWYWRIAWRLNLQSIRLFYYLFFPLSPISLYFLLFFLLPFFLPSFLFHSYLKRVSFLYALSRKIGHWLIFEMILPSFKLSCHCWLIVIHSPIPTRLTKSTKY